MSEFCQNNLSNTDLLFLMGDIPFKKTILYFFILHRYVPVAENIIHMNNISSIVSIPASRFGSKGENASLTL